MARRELILNLQIVREQISCREGAPLRDGAEFGPEIRTITRTVPIGIVPMVAPAARIAILIAHIENVHG